MKQNDIIKGKVYVKNLHVVYKKNFCAVDNLSFVANPGEFLCIIGPSGCGKTTILNTIAGFIKPTSGHIFLDKNIVESPSSDKGFVFQKYVLFPWKTVIENVEFGLKMRGLSEKKRRYIAKKYINLVNLNKFKNAYPNELSGGMEQRVGIARVLANNPILILMDEPFASLDAITRLMMQELLLNIYERTKKTIIFVTHAIDEAILLADRIMVLTNRPAQIKKLIKVNIPRPRSYEKLLSSKSYIRLKENILSLIKEEINL